MGERWQHQAARPGVASDCLGLVSSTGLALGIQGATEWATDKSMQGYGVRPDAAAIRAGCRKYLDPIPIAQAGLGDIFVMRFDGEEQHFAIVSCLDPLRVIHSFARPARKVTESPITGEWKHGKTWQSLIVSAWRFRGLK